MSEDAAKYNDQPASERSCPDAAGSRFLDVCPECAGTGTSVELSEGIGCVTAWECVCKVCLGTGEIETERHPFDCENTEDRHEAQQSQPTEENL